MAIPPRLIITASKVLCHLSQLDKGLLYALPHFPNQHFTACNWLHVPAFPRSDIPIYSSCP